jgi:hypothetical protein
MENKYYTPDISEFYIGFEYILRLKPQIENNYIGNYIVRRLKDSNFNDFEWISNTLNNPNKLDEILVKYLDKEDIESLGFEYHDMYIDSYGLVFKKVKNGYEEECRIDPEVTYNYHWIIYYPLERIPTLIIKNNWDYQEEDKSIFYGQIKNKSELIRLLKQLEISEDKSN